MDREIEQTPDLQRPETGSRLTLSQGRAGTSANDERPQPTNDRTRLARRIEEAAAGRPSVPEFIARLEKEGVRVLPSLQASGRLNGFTYVVQGTRIRGSELGRCFTPQGLQKRFGLHYDRTRDEEALRRVFGARDIAAPLERAPESRRREPVRDQGRVYFLSESGRETLKEIGRFRTLDEKDLARYRYGGDQAKLGQDLRSLVAQGLLKRHQGFARGGQKLSVAVLTKEGRKFTEKGESAQTVYSGFVKPAEIAHDTAIYRMYQAEAGRIRQEGGHITRVVLDYELKKNVYAPLAKARELPPLEYARRQGQIARDNHLTVVDGKILLPDLRIEYETREGTSGRVDLELATEHYHGKQLTNKAQAGFKMYADVDSAARLSAVLDDHDIMAGILSL